jgi:hypothetical protein
MARTTSKRGLGFLLIVAVLVYALISGGVALSTGRDCSDKGLVREWNFVPPRWDCKPGVFVPAN